MLNVDYSSENRYRDFDRQFTNSKSYSNSSYQDEENQSDNFFESTLDSPYGSPKRNTQRSSSQPYVNTTTGEIIDEYPAHKVEAEIDDEEEIVTPVKRKPRKAAPAKVKYLGWFDWKGLSRGEIFSRLAWLFCFGMVLRLVSMDQGVIDFVKMENRLSARENILKEIQLENKDLMNEIDLIKNNPAYQKKLVRDHLGAISSDEFLILFPNDTGAVPN